MLLLCVRTSASAASTPAQAAALTPSAATPGQASAVTASAGSGVDVPLPALPQAPASATETAALNPIPAPPGSKAAPGSASGTAKVLAVPVRSVRLPAGAAAPRPSRGLSAPLYLTAIAGNRRVELSWYPAVPAAGVKPPAGYLVFRGLAGGRISPRAINVSPVAQAYYVDDDDDSESGPLDRRTYVYRVRAYGPDGLLSPYSLTATARPSGPLLPPGRFRAHPGDGEVRLTWIPPLSTGDADLADYALFRGPDAGHLVRYRILAPDTVSFTDRGVPDGKAWCYALAADATDRRRSTPTNAVRAVAYQALPAPTGLSGMGLGEDIVRLTWSPPDGSGTFPLRGYNVYRSTGGPVDYDAPPLNRVLVGGPEFEDDSDNSVSPPAMGKLYSYTVVAVDSEGGLSAPGGPYKAGPVASITKLDVGTFDVMSGNTLQIQGRKTISVSDTWMLWRQNAGNTYGAYSPSSFALNQQLQVQLSGEVGRKIKVDVDYDDSAASNQQQKISVVYEGDQSEVVKQFAFGDIQMDLDSSRTQFASYNKSLFGAQLKIASPDGRLRLTAVGAQTQGFTETKTFTGGYEEVMNGTVPGQNYPDTAFIPYQYYYLSREEDLLEGSNNVVPGSVSIWVDQPGVSNLNPQKVTVTNPTTGTTFNFVPLSSSNYTVNYKSGLVTFTTPMQANYNIVVAFRTAQNMTGCGCSMVGYQSTSETALSPGDLSNDASDLASNTLSGVTDQSHLLIQYGSENASTGYDGHMSCQFYSMGDRGILDPSQDPNFKFIIYGANNSIVYQLATGADYTSVVNFNTTLGIMAFRVPYPFQQGNGEAAMTAYAPNYTDVGVLYNGSNQDCYNLVTRVSNYTIHVEYQHQMTDYQLRPNIVNGSDVVTVNGRRMIRNVDYFLDYTTGILVFNNPATVTSSSTVQATYEYLPFGSQFASTVWGGRGEYDFNDDLSVGATYINDSANAPQQTPQIGAGVYSLQILDGDVQAQVPQKALDSLTHAISPQSGFLKIKASAETAESWYNPNTYSRNNENGVAMVDDFESVNSIVAASTLRDTWFPASLPDLSEVSQLNGKSQNPMQSNPQASISGPNARKFTDFSTQSLQAYDSSVLVQAGDNPLVNQLQLNWTGYTPVPNGQAGGGQWDGYVYSFGPTPNQSISQANQIQIWLRTTAPVTIHVDCGQINEDAVDNGTLATESTTGYLAAGEDIGIDNPSTTGSPYPCPQNDPSLYPDQDYWGWNNSILDTEDFDQTGVLDTTDAYYYFAAAVDPAVQSPGTNNGYQEVVFDMTQPNSMPAGYQWGLVTPTSSTILSCIPGNSNYYTNISRLRVWVDGAGAANGSLVIESLQFVGDKWQVRADPNVVNSFTNLSNTTSGAPQVYAINESTAVSLTAGVQYVPDTDFYTVDSTNSVSVETALELLYTPPAPEQASGTYAGEPAYQVRRILSTGGTPTDFGEYQNLRLDVFKPNYNSTGALKPGGGVVTNDSGEFLLVRLAADDQDYFEYSVPLDNVGAQGWQTVVLPLDGSGGQRTQYGTPYLRQINYVSFSVRTPSNAQANTQVPQEALWLNNLRVTDPVTRQGSAKRFDVNYSLMGGKITVDQSYKEVDADFVQIDQQDNPPLQNTINQALSANVNLLPWLPTTASYNEDQIFTAPGEEGDPFYSQNFSDPNQTDDKLALGTTFGLVPGLSVAASGYVQHVRQTFLEPYITAEEQNLGLDFDPNNTQQNTHEQVQAGYQAPEKLPVLGGNRVMAEVDYDTAATDYDQPVTVTGTTTQFLDLSTIRRTLKASYNGTYRAGKWLVVSPTFSYSEVDAEGNVAAPSNLGQGTTAYLPNAYGQVDGFTPQQRSINPQLDAQIGDLGPVQNTHFSYNFTQNMDYTQNQMETPGTVNLSTNLNPSVLGPAWRKVPALNLSQAWQMDSIINDNVTVRGPLESAELEAAIQDDPALEQQYAGLINGSSAIGGSYGNPGTLTGLEAVPNLALESQAPWYQSVWMPRLGFAGQDFFSGPYDIEDLASSATRRSTTTLSSHFDLTLLPGWAGEFSPRASYSDARIMSAPEQITENEQTGFGADIVFQRPHIPFWTWLRPDNLTFDGSFTYSQNWLDDVETPPALSSVATSYNLKLTLPMRPTEKSTVTASMGATVSTTEAFEDVGDGYEPASSGNTLSLTPGLEWVYLINMSRPIRLPNFWPFYGREVRLSQAIRLDNRLTATINSAYQNATTATLNNTASDLYTLLNTLSYNVLENVRVSFSLENDYMLDPYADQAINQPGGYYSIKVSLGADATF